MAKQFENSLRNGLSAKLKTWVGSFLLLFILITGLSPDLLALEEAPRKRVLVLHSYYQGYKWTDDENRGIESILKPAIGTNNLYIEYMDTKKIFGDLYSQRLYEVYKLKYRNFKFDSIIVTDNNAFDFIRKYHNDLFPGTPVVFCGVNYFDEYHIKAQTFITGINEENDLKACVEMMLKLHPKTKQIVFINEWTTTGQGVHKAFLKIIPYFQGLVQFSLLEDVKIEELLDQLVSLSEDSLVLYTAFSRDKSGKLFDYDEIVSLIASRCKVPIYTTNEFNLGLGVVGGIVVHGYDQGEAAAKMALRILRGEKPEDIPVMMTSPKRNVFDYAQMQRFGISRSHLPKDSLIVNLPQTFYFKYKKWVDGIIIVLAMLLSIISVLLVNINKRKKTEKALKVSREQLRTLGWRLAETEETQRKALSRELHDQIGQNLTILGVNLNILRSLVPKNVTDIIHARISDSLLLVKQTTERTRSLMNNLRSPVIDDYGLVAAIDLYGKQFSSRTGIDTIVRVSDANPHFTPNIENAVFRIVQESLTNVLKHAQATQVVINVNVSADRLLLSVEDNGIGYDMTQITNGNGERGWGLITMKERALAVGGTCRMQSRPGMGTHIIVEVPI
jgi:signal transduction histidine kinase